MLYIATAVDQSLPKSPNSDMFLYSYFPNFFGTYTLKSCIRILQVIILPTSFTYLRSEKRGQAEQIQTHAMELSTSHPSYFALF